MPGVLGRAESKHEEDDIEVGLDQTKPLDVGLLKTRAFIVNTR